MPRPATTWRLALLFTLLLSLLAACGGNAPAVENTPAPATSAPDTASSAAAAPPGYDGQSWADVLAEARGQTVNFYMWGGSDLINTWIVGTVAPRVAELYGVTLNMVPVGDATEYINKVLGEKEAGRDADGTVDLVWINGENFRTMRQGDLLYGRWAQFLPNSIYVNPADPSVANDFGFPVDGYESPYGKAQFVMIYDSARVPEPPTTIDGLLAWIEANPGRFTYPAPPDFTGSAFVRHVCYWAVGGYEPLLGEFDQALFDERLPACWEALNRIEPFLWRGGETYPETATRQQDLFANGEVDFDMAYNPAEASSLVENGRYPETTRTFVFDTGTIANTHYVAIPYNSPAKAAAMVVANYLLSPEAQLSKAQPANWGDLPVLDPALLPADQRAAFDAIPRGVATLPTETLAANRLPELQAPWLTAIEQAWEAEVLQK
ncbi:MAG: ABC transporter substrate-binding protein [Anaerolineales bacterium]|nr:ABC transporter substrate-binding protein [Anaerolineales bacterium]